MNGEHGLNGFEKAAARFTEIELALDLADPAQFIAAAPRT
jgi:hypothetical protein